MAGTYNYDGSKIEVTDGTTDEPANFADMYTADLAGTFSLHDRNGVVMVDGSPVAVTNALQPADDKVLGGLTAIGESDLNIVVENWDFDSATIRITGTNRRNKTITEDLSITGNGTYPCTLEYKTVVSTQVTATGGAGTSFDYALIQDRWGVVWEIETDGQYKIDCPVDFGDGSTSTFFRSQNEQVYFTDGNIFLVKGNLDIGINTSNDSQKGSCWSWQQDGTILGSAGGVLSIYASQLIYRGSGYIDIKLGTVNIRNCIASNVGHIGRLYFWANLATLNIEDLYCNDWLYLLLYANPDTANRIGINGGTTGTYLQDATIEDMEITNVSAYQVIMSSASTAILKNPRFTINPAKLLLQNADSILIEQYTCNIHVTDSDGADLTAVDIDCEYAHLVEGSDSKTYKCTADHTAVDATHKPITGTDWEDYWELYNASGGDGGDWSTGFAYKSGTAEFSTQTVDANGDMTQQVIQYKKWVGTSETEEVRIHKFIFTHADYPDFVMSNKVINEIIDWEFDMGQTDANLTALIDAAITANTDINNIVTGVNNIEAVTIAGAAGANIAVDIIAIKAETATILTDTGTTLDDKLDAIPTDPSAPR